MLVCDLLRESSEEPLIVHILKLQLAKGSRIYTALGKLRFVLTEITRTTERQHFGFSPTPDEKIMWKLTFVSKLGGTYNEWIDEENEARFTLTKTDEGLELVKHEAN
jgi:hypothetical protein